MANTKVTSRVLANDAVLTANIADDQVTTAKIADDQITSALVADDLALGGNPTTTTQSAGNNTTRIATTAFVTTAVANIVDSAPSALDTLNELAAALGDDANFSTTITNSIAAKLPLAGGTMTGGLSITVADNSDNLTLTSTDEDANDGANLRLYRNSASPADNDFLGHIQFEGRNDNSQDVIYAELGTQLKDASDGTEDGRLMLNTMVGGTLRSRISIDPAEVVINEEGLSTLDFRVESDTKANAFLVDASTNRIGIGTGTPQAHLDINTETAEATTVILNGEANQDKILKFRHYANSEAAGDGYAGFIGSVVDNVLTLGHYNSSNTEVQTLHVTEGGKVGIGTSDPNDELDIAAVHSQLRLTDTDDSKFVQFSYSGGKLVVRNNSTNTTANQFTLTEDGNLGIGTISPATTLEVNGGIRLSGLNGGDGLKFDLAGSSDFVMKESSTNDVFQMGALFHNISSNALGVGVAPDVALEVVTSDPRLRLRDNTAGGGSGNGGKVEFMGHHAGSSDGSRMFAEIHGLKNNSTGGDTKGDLLFFTNQGSASTTEGMRLNKDGDFIVGDTDFPSGSNSCFGAAAGGTTSVSRAATNLQTQIFFQNPNGTVGSIKTTGTTTQFNTSSDYRLKENVVTDWDGTTLLKQLKPSKFNFKTDASTTVHGFLAHEVSGIVPEAVSGTKDDVYTEADENNREGTQGQPKYQGIDQSKLVPLLVKTIQELEARIKTLEDA